MLPPRPPFHYLQILLGLAVSLKIQLNRRDRFMHVFWYCRDLQHQLGSTIISLVFLTHPCVNVLPPLLPRGYYHCSGHQYGPDSL